MPPRKYGGKDDAIHLSFGLLLNSNSRARARARARARKYPTCRPGVFFDYDDEYRPLRRTEHEHENAGAGEAVVMSFRP